MPSVFENALKTANNVIFNTFYNCEVILTVNGSNTLVKGVLDKAYAEDLDVIGDVYTLSFNKSDFSTPVVGMTIKAGIQNFEVFSFEDDLSGQIILNLKEL